jgi:hypothetical protein
MTILKKYLGSILALLSGIIMALAIFTQPFYDIDGGGGLLSQLKGPLHQVESIKIIAVAYLVMAVVGFINAIMQKETFVITLGIVELILAIMSKAWVSIQVTNGVSTYNVSKYIEYGAGAKMLIVASAITVVAGIVIGIFKKMVKEEVVK